MGRGIPDASATQSKGDLHYKGASLIRNPPPEGPNNRTMPMVLGWSWGEARLLISEVSLSYQHGGHCDGVPRRPQKLRHYGASFPVPLDSRLCLARGDQATARTLTAMSALPPTRLCRAGPVQGSLAHQKSPPHQDHHRNQGKVLL